MLKIDAVKYVARNLADLIVDSTPASLTGSSVDITKLIHPGAEQLTGKDFYIYSGAGAGQQRTVGSFSPTNRRLVFAEVFASVPSINSNIILLNHFTKDELDNAVERAIGWAKLHYLQDKVATLSLVATQYEYPVPSAFIGGFINRLQLIPSGSTDYQEDADTANVQELPPRFFSVFPNALGTYVIKIDPRKVDLGAVDDHWVNIIGQTKPDIAATDNATVPTDIEEYVIAGATKHLAASRVNDTAKEWANKFRIYDEIFSRLEESIYRRPVGRKVG